MIEKYKTAFELLKNGCLEDARKVFLQIEEILLDFQTLIEFKLLISQEKFPFDIINYYILT